MFDRISFQDGLDLFKNADLVDLKERAQKARFEKNKDPYVTFVLDSNPNYTNICNADCNFCAFYRKKSAKDAYFKTVEEVMGHFKFANEAGLTTVLLQGGVHEGISIDYLISLVKEARQRYPHIHPHFFSAVEIWNAAKSSQISIKEALLKLYDAGLRTIPGGGAEILSERIRSSISPKKMEPSGWIEVHHTAHQIGFKTTATMMYGHIEEPEDIVIHLETLRQAQDKIPGFTCFIPWSYKRERTALRKMVKNWAGKDAYFRILAFSRLYLDNFKHIGASWFGEGKEIGIEALHYGADDFGGTILEENVHRATGWINRTDHNGMIQMIRQAGFEPAQRDTFYNILRTYENVDKVEIPEKQLINEQDCLPSLNNSSK